MKRKRDSPDSSTISISGELTQHIIEEILKYFPVKSLLRFRAVSKGFRAKIDSMPFTKEQYSNMKDRLLLRLEIWQERTEEFVNDYRKNSYNHVVGSINYNVRNIHVLYDMYDDELTACEQPYQLRIPHHPKRIPHHPKRVS